MLLFMYDRLPLTSLKLEGDPHLFDLLRSWEPEE
jgi:hypothetical protein